MCVDNENDPLSAHAEKRTGGYRDALGDEPDQTTVGASGVSNEIKNQRQDARLSGSPL